MCPDKDGNIHSNSSSEAANADVIVETTRAACLFWASFWLEFCLEHLRQSAASAHPKHPKRPKHSELPEYPECPEYPTP